MPGPVNDWWRCSEAETVECEPRHQNTTREMGALEARFCVHTHYLPRVLRLMTEDHWSGANDT